MSAFIRAFQQFETRFLSRYHGVEGGVLLRGKFFKQLGEKNAVFKTCNNALWTAPAWKWGLAVVPLYGAVTGSQPVENVDLNQALALSFTGVVWSYYGLLVKPTAYLLVAVNIALLGANGYNVARRVKYDMDQKQNDTVIEVVE